MCTGPTTLSGATASNYSLLTWTTSGDGTFINVNSLTPIYTPGPTDIINGTVTLTLTATAAAPCTGTLSDNVIYTVIDLQSNAGVDATICETSTYLLSGATASGYSTLLWSSSGTGSFNNATILNPTYIPSVADITSGSIVLTLTAYHPPCTSVSNSMVLTIISNPVANAGTDGNICEESSYTVFDATSLHASSVLWTTAGTGNLQNPTSLSPTYTPSAADVAAGSVSLTMTAYAATPCLVNDMDNMTIFLTPLPTASAGADATICEGDNHTIAGSSATNYSSLNWTTNGDGTFAGGTGLLPTYTPGSNDRLIGTVTLTLTSYATSPCSINALDQMILTITRDPIVSAGPDATICSGSTFPIISATSLHSNTILWTSSGTGTFSDATALLPIYTPSLPDIATGNVTLTLTGTSAAPCLHTDLDAMLLTIISAPQADAGSDATICEDGNFPITTAAASSYSSITWTTSGNGTFSNVSIINPVYTPGLADIAAGSVNLTLTANSNPPCTGTDNDFMVLTLSKIPVINAGTDVSICEGNTYTTSSATQLYSSSLTWTTSGSGSFSNATVLNTTYTPSPADILNGTVLLTLTAGATAPCTGNVTDDIVVTITRTPSANAGSDATICQGTFTITGANALHYLTLLWSTSGTGTFNYTNIIAPIYTPSIADIAAGTVTLTLTANPNSPCGSAATDDMVLTINPFPTAYAGADANICEGETYSISGATATYYSAILWTTSGDGIVANETTFTPTYTPGAGDITAGSVTLTLTSTGILPCTNAVTDEMTINIQALPDVDAGPAGTICQGSTYTTSGAVVSNALSTLWTSSGTGTFTNASQLMTIYTPSALDITNGGVTLTLTATSMSPCVGTVADTRTLTITPSATAYAGPNSTICATSNFTVSLATATNYISLNWTSTGTGSFTGNGTLTPTYTPSAADILVGSINLILTATPAAPCLTTATSFMTLTIDPTAEVYAGADAAVCEGGTYNILDATASYNTTINWSTTGTGSFLGSNTLTPTYTPSADDVTAGSVILTATVTSISPCTLTVTDDMLLTVTSLPDVYAGPDGTTCGATPFNITAATEANAVSVVWTTSGTGTFTNTTALNPDYTPSSADIAAGTVTLTLTGISGSGCTTNPSDSFILTIVSPATAYAGADASVCENGTYTVNDATATNYTSVNWTTTGSGTLSGAGTLTPSYTPSAADLIAGTVTLTLHSTATPPCTNTTDQMILSILAIPVVNAGPDASTCAGTNYAITLATAQYSSSVSWASSGTGTFSNPNILLPVYTASAADISAGSVILTLTAQPNTPCNGVVTDSFVLSFTPAATANAGTDVTICQTNTFTVSTASASNYASLNWTTSGTGSFTSGTTLTPTYTPSAADITAGSVVLTLHSLGNTPCTEATDNMTLTILHSPVASAGATASICEGSSYTVGDATASYYSSLLWTTTGTGTLTNPTTLTPSYLPSAGDITVGSVTLTLTAFATSPCTGQVTSSKVLLLQAAPLANAGSDATICEPDDYTIAGSSASNYSLLNWTSNGTGSFTGNGTLTPTYQPSSADFISGLVTLTLHVTGISPCSTPATDAMDLHLIQAPTANAGPDGSICQGGSFTVSGASVANEASFYWTSSGSGTLSNPTTLTPTYTPAPLETGTITLTLTAESNPPCVGDATDQMIITIQEGPTASAGLDATICEGSSHTLSGTVTNNASYTWTSNGSGTFSNSNTLTPTYTPSTADILAGSVVITLTSVAILPCAVNATDAMTLTLISSPDIYAGADATICSTGGYLLSEATASHYLSILWSTSGDGTFSNPGSVQPTYAPGATDITNGQVTLTLTGQPVSPCTQPVSDAMILQINGIPTANAGPDVTICAGSYTLSGASATNYSSLLWTSGGTGTLTNATTLTPTYTPSAGDITVGTVTLTLTVTGISPCTGQATDVLTLTITPTPTANAGSDASICEGNTFTVTNATASNFLLLVWTHNGNGTLTNSGTLTPTYTPGLLDLITGSVTLTLTATSNPPCAVPATDQMVIQIVPLPVLDAGPDASICGGTFTATGTSASHYDNIYWTTSGTGSFTNSTTLNPTYTPSVADITAGSVILTLHGVSLTPCTGELTDAMVLSLLPAPTADAGANATICSGNSYTLSGSSATNYSSLNWTSSGSGTFSNNTILHPTYFPSAADRSNGSVILTLGATGIAPCNGVTEDAMVLTIAPVAIANAGPDASICAGSIYTLTLASASYYSTLDWQTSGSGTFSNSTLLNPTYTPSAADITAGTVTLILNATGIAPCTGVSTDQMVLSIIHPALADAGPDASICAGNSYYVPAASASNYSTIYWATSGTGTFLNGTTITPTYQPSAADIAAGSVTLTIHAVSVSPCLGEVTDGLVLTILPTATSYAGGDANICAGNSYLLSGAQATLYSAINWTTSGSGTFSNASILNPTYFPSVTDIAAGTVTLTLHVTGILPCASVVSDAMILQITPAPTVNAGPDATACTATYLVTGASATNYVQINWTTTGTGTFTNGNTLSPTYFPSQADLNAGSVRLWLNATSISPCTGLVSNDMLLTLPGIPNANAGIDASICEGSAYVVTGATATNYSSFLWSTSGTGTFSNPGTFTPTYTPSAADIALGSVTLTLTVTGSPPCNSVVADAMLLTITKLSVCDAGPAATICSGNNYILSGASASNYSALLWGTSGTGTFQSFNIINPTYVPSAADIAAGSVTLTLTAFDLAPCTGNSTDAMVLTIIENVSADAGPDDGVCYPASYTVTAATASNYLSLSWSSTGTGTFANTTTLHPTYYPSLTDLNMGSVTLTLHATGNSPCSGTVNDYMILSIENGPGAAGTIIGTTPVCINQSGVGYSIPTVPAASGYVWSLPSGATIASGSNTNAITVDFGPSAISGNITVYPTNSCGSGTISSPFYVQVNFPPGNPGTISGIQTVCQGTQGVTYSINPLPTATGYNWTVPAGAVIVSGNNSPSIVVNFSSTAVSGNITVAGTNSCGVGLTSTLAITVDPMPPVPTISAGGPTSFCEGGNVTLTASPSGYTYLWSPGGEITQSIIASTTGSYSVVISTAIGCQSGPSNIINVTVSPLPDPAGNISGPSEVCAGQTNVIYSVLPITNATGYNWTLPSGATIVSGANTNSITVNFSLSAVSGTITVAGTNACGSGAPSPPYTVTVSTSPGAAGVILGSSVVCQGQSGVIYSVAAIINATGYTWTVPPGATIVSGLNTNSITVNFSTTASSGTVTVQGTNACGGGTVSAPFAVTVNPIPLAAGPITGLSAVCAGQTTVLYSVQPIIGATSYIWTVPSGATIVSGQGTQGIIVNYSTTATSGLITVSGSNSCGVGPSSSLAITVDVMPSLPGVIVGTPVVCQGQTGVVYSVPMIGNATSYSWTLPTGATIVGGAGTNIITVNFSTTATSGNIIVAGVNACGTGPSSNPYMVTVNGLPGVPGVISGPPTVCQGQGGVTYTVAAIANATGYIWTVPLGATIVSGSNTNTITVDFSPTASNGNITVQGTNACGTGSVSAPFAVTMNLLPSPAGTITGLTSVCVGQTSVLYSVPPITGATAYSWTVPSGATIVSGQGTQSIIVDYSASATSGSITVSGTNLCGSGPSSSISITVGQVPDTPGNIIGNPAVCQGQTGVVYMVPVIGNATSYNWVVPSGATIVSGDGTNIITVDFSANAVTGNILVAGVNACGSGPSSNPYTVTVNELPGTPGGISGYTTPCQGETGVVYSVPSITNATGYIWTVPFGATIVSGNNTNTITVNFSATASSGSITVQGTNSCGIGVVSAPLNIILDLLPEAAGAISGLSTVCQGQTGVIYSVLPIPNAIGYDWTLPAGATIISGVNTNIITVLFDPTSTSGTITVAGTNACGSGLASVPFPVVVNTLPNPAGIITGTATVCQGQLGVYYWVQPILGATGYNWTLPAGATIVAGYNTSSIMVDFSGSSASGFVTVEGTNDCGSGQVSAPYPVVVNISPEADYIYSSNRCVGENVQFTDQSIENGGGAIVSWLWSFGDPGSGASNSSSLQNPTHAFTSAGNHTVTLIITNVSGCTSLSSQVVDVNAHPIADFSNTTPCLGTAVDFTDFSIANAPFILSWDWDFGDGSAHSTAQHPSHLYTTHGLYDVTLVVTNSNGCVDTKTKTVEVTIPPTAAFISTLDNCAGAPVEFTDQSTVLSGYIAQWTWNFGDGTTPVIINYPGPANTQHVYALPGTYDVTLTVESSNNCFASITHQVTVTSGPIAGYSYGTNRCPGQPVHFIDNSLPNGSGPITIWQWDFGDPSSGVNNLSNLQNPQHIFAAGGFYDVTLTVVNINGCSSTITTTIEIFLSPEADFSFTSTCLGSATDFTDLSVPNATAIASWDWDFGDGSNHSSQQNPSHTYLFPGTYNVTLIVVNSNGCSNAVTKFIQVMQPPDAEFVTSTQNCASSPVYFTDQSFASQGYITQWTWDFGDGTAPLIVPYPGFPVVTHQYALGGTYSVTLTVETSLMCSSSITHQVVVTERPLANYTYTNNNCAGTPVSFTDISQTNGGGPIISWSWNFDDPMSGTSNLSLLQNPVHSFSSAGPYDVRLIVTNDYFCRDTIIQTVTIGDSPIADFTFDTVCSGTATSFTDLSIPNATSMLSWEWDYGDGNQQTIYYPNPPSGTHLYSAPGTYQVTLTVVNIDGCSQSVTKSAIVVVPPDAEFTYAGQNCAQTLVTFTDQSHANHGYIIRWHWEFGDGSDTTITNPTSNSVSHVYATGGAYAVILTVKTSDSCSSSVSHIVSIDFAPIANFSFSGTQCTDSPVQFLDLSQTNGGAAINQWYWDFGDPNAGTNNISTLKNPTHLFTSSGTFIVKHIVISAYNCSDTIEKTVIVNVPPLANFSHEVSCPGSPTIFTNLSVPNSASMSTYDWDFGDGTPHSNLENPTHVFYNPGTYNVNLQVQNSNQCVHDTTISVIIFELPQAAFVSNAPLCIGEPVDYTNQSTTQHGWIVRWVWDFGDGTTQTISFPGIPNVTHTFQGAASQHTVRLTVVTSDSCSNYTEHIINSAPSPVANFYNSPSLCMTENVSFTDISQLGGGGPISSWSWNFDDPLSGTSNLSSLQNPTHAFATAGVHNVRLIVVNYGSCVDTIIKPLTINEEPIADFTADTACLGTPTQFTDTSIPNAPDIVAWHWDFGDGTPPSNAADPIHLFMNQGNYTVRLTVTNTNGCIATTSKIVPVNLPPFAAFSTSTNNCAGSPVSFVNESTTSQGYITTWVWTFGDGNSVTVTTLGNPNVTHIYTSSGTFLVTLAVEASDGCTSTISHNITVNAAPVPNFYSTTANCEGVPVQFTDLTQLNGGGALTNWYWDFGDPGSGVLNYSTQQNPQHSYLAQGTYAVTQIVTNIHSCSDTIVKSVTVEDGPVADFTADMVCLGNATQFTDASSTTLGSIISWSWDFGDGSTGSTQQNPTHVYSAIGIYTVSLTVINSSGCIHDTSHMVMVLDIPDAMFAWDGGCKNSATYFTDQSTVVIGSISEWLWDFGDGVTATVQNPEHTYANAGMYSVKLVVTNTSGCQDSITLPIVIYQQPLAEFDYYSTYCPSGRVTFTDQSLPNGSPIVGWEWTFEEGYTSSDPNPSYTFNVTDTTYLVTLVVTDLNGCLDTIINPVDVEAGFAFSINADSTCLGIPMQFEPVILAPGDTLHGLTWNFGEPSSGTYNTSTLYYPEHTYANSGTYVVKLKAYNSNNCVDSVYKDVVVNPLPIADFSYDPIAYCDTTITFHNLCQPPVGSYIDTIYWEFGDGTDTLLFDPIPTEIIHLYPDFGLYDVTVTVLSKTGCIVEVTETLQVSCIQAIVDPIGAVQCQKTPLVLADSSKPVNLIDQWTWNFGDGTPDTTYTQYAQEIEHTWVDTGSYILYLAIESTNNGFTVYDTTRVTVHINPSPIAAFTVDPVCFGDSSRFISLVDSNGVSVNSLMWTFGNPGSGVEDTSLVENPTHLYTKPGSFTTTLTIGNILGCEAVVEQPVTVYKIPDAAFENSKACSRYDIEFEDQSILGDTLLSQWRWHFGDPDKPYDTVLLQDPTYRYNIAGQYEVFLKVFDYNECFDTIRQIVDVLSSPTAAFMLNENVDGMTGNIELVNQSIGALAYSWDFGNGNSSSDENPRITFDDDGTYLITLTVWNSNGCYDTTAYSYEFAFQNLFIPNAFSPTNVNLGVRLFKPVGLNLQNYHIMVFDQWGELIWESTAVDKDGRPIEGWDGTYKGNLMPQGTYIWKVNAVFKTGKIWEGSSIGIGDPSTMGTVILIR